MHIESSPTDPASLAELDEVMSAAFEVTTFADEVGWYAVAQPDGLVRCVDRGEVVGTACWIAYPESGFGWIGLVATRPGQTRRGIGQAVTERCVDQLAELGCRAALDASAKGSPVYTRIGFTDHGPTTMLAAGDIAPYRGDLSVRRYEPGLFDEVIALDRDAFGADRSDLLTLVLTDHGARSVVVRDDERRLVGCVVVRPDRVGPVIAHTPDALHAALAAAAGANGELRMSVPPECEHHELLASLGFRRTRELRHMRLGLAALPARGERYVARVTLGYG